MLSIRMKTAASSPATPLSPTDDARAAAADLRMATFRLARRLRSQRAVDTMSDGQFAVLAALKIHGPHTLGELADRDAEAVILLAHQIGCRHARAVEKEQRPEEHRPATAAPG